jgi:hypothetical protein
MTDLKPSRELDALIAEKVMGWRPMQSFPFKQEDWPAFCDLDGREIWQGDIPHFSTDIAAAWEVVEKIPMTIYAPGAPYADGEYCNHGQDYDDEDDPTGIGPWAAEADHPDKARLSDRVYGVSGPHAICLAALRAVGVM